MISNRPYLLRAFHQWIIDSQCTPILVIDATNPHCKVPKDYAEGDEISFNISPMAVRDLDLGNDYVRFKASFSGVIHIIAAPLHAILAVYADENGEGIFFDAEEETSGVPQANVPLKSIDGGYFSDGLEQQVKSSRPRPEKSKPFLKLVE